MLWPATLRGTGNTFDHLSIHDPYVDGGPRQAKRPPTPRPGT
jgi:hypothetical protein